MAGGLGGDFRFSGCSGPGVGPQLPNPPPKAMYRAMRDSEA